MRRALKLFSTFVLVGLFAVLGLVIVNTAYAAEEDLPHQFTVEERAVVNPVYEGIVKEEDLQRHNRRFFSSGNPGNVFDNCEEAADYVREQMVNRADVIEAAIPVQIYSQEEAQMVFDTNSELIMEKAQVHTGVPVEGDYIQWQYGGYSSKAEFSWVSGSTYNMMITYAVTQYTTRAEEDQVTAEVESALAGMDLEGRTGYDKARIIYDWVAQSADYDYSALEQDYDKAHTAYNCIHEHSCVCQGYSLLLYRMLLEAGIDNRMFGGGDHIWNTIKVENAYYMSDATWDSHGYGNPNNHNYFLKGVDQFSSSGDQHSKYMSLLFDPLDGYNLAANAYGCASHRWNSDYTIEVPPTTQKAGRKSIHCASCEMTKDEEPITKLQPCNHVWDIDYTTDAEATCHSTGLESIHCQLCGEKQEGSERIIPVDPNLHSWVTVTVKPASFAESGIEQSECKTCKVIGEKNVIPKVAVPTISKTKYVYNGKVQKPKVAVIGLSSPYEYKVTWTNGKDVGKQTATVTLVGDRFTGSTKLNYTIDPKGTSISKLTRGSKCFTVKWSRQLARMSKTPVTGYQVRYSCKSSMSGARTVSIKGYTKYSKKISMLKANKRYYVQVRTYKTVDGTRYYSAWSAKKYVRTK